MGGGKEENVDNEYLVSKLAAIFCESVWRSSYFYDALFFDDVFSF